MTIDDDFVARMRKLLKREPRLSDLLAWADLFGLCIRIRMADAKGVADGD